MAITLNTTNTVYNQPFLTQVSDSFSLAPRYQLFMQLALALYNLKNPNVETIQDLPTSFKVLEIYLGMGFDLKKSLQLMKQQDQQLVLQLSEDLGGETIFRAVSGLDLNAAHLDNALFQLASDCLDKGREDAYLIFLTLLSQKKLVEQSVVSVVVQEQAVAKLQALKGEGKFGEQLNYRLRVLPHHVFRAEGIIGMTAAFMTFRYVKGVTLELLANQAPKALVESMGWMFNRGPLAIAQANTAAFVGENIAFSGISSFAKYYREGKLTAEELWHIVQTNLVVTGLIKVGMYGARVAEGSIHGIGADGLATQYLEFQNITRGLTQNIVGIGAMSFAAPLEYQMGLRQERPSFGLALGEGLSGHVSASLSNRLSGVAMQSHNNSMQQWDKAIRFYSKAIGDSPNTWWEGMRETMNAWSEKFPSLEAMGFRSWQLAMAMVESGAAPERPMPDGVMLRTITPFGTEGETSVWDTPINRERPVRFKKDNSPIHVEQLTEDKIDSALSAELRQAFITQSGGSMPITLLRSGAKQFSQTLSAVFLTAAAAYQHESATLQGDTKSIQNNPNFLILAEITRLMEYFNWSGQDKYVEEFFKTSPTIKNLYYQTVSHVKEVYQIDLNIADEAISQNYVELEQGMLTIGAGDMVGLSGVLRYKMRPGQNYLPFYYGLQAMTLFPDVAKSVNGSAGQGEKGLVNAKNEPEIHAIVGHITDPSRDTPEARIARRIYKYQILAIPSFALAAVVTKDYIRNLPQGATLISPVKGIVGFKRAADGKLVSLAPGDLDNPSVEIVETYRPDHYIQKVIAEHNIETARQSIGKDGKAEQDLKEFFRAVADPTLLSMLDTTRESPLPPSAVELFYMLTREYRQQLISQLLALGGTYQTLAEKIKPYQAIDHITIVPVEGFFPPDKLYNGEGVELKFYGPKDSPVVAKIAALYNSDIVPTGVSDRFQSGVWGGIYKNVATLAEGYDVATLAIVKSLYEQVHDPKLKRARSKKQQQQLAFLTELAKKLKLPEALPAEAYDLTRYSKTKLDELIKDMVYMLRVNEGVSGVERGVPFDNEVMDDVRYCGDINVAVLLDLVKIAFDRPADQITHAWLEGYYNMIVKSPVAATRNTKRGIVLAIHELIMAKLSLYYVNLPVVLEEFRDSRRYIFDVFIKDGGEAQKLPITFEGEASWPVLIARAHGKKHVQQRRLPEFVYRIAQVIMPKRFQAMGELPSRLDPFIFHALRERVEVNGAAIDRQQLQNALDHADQPTLYLLNQLFKALGERFEHRRRSGVDQKRRSEKIKLIDQINAAIYLINEGISLGKLEGPQQLDFLPFENAFSIGLLDGKSKTTLAGAYTQVKVNAEQAKQLIPTLGQLLRRYQNYPTGYFYVDLVLTGQEMHGKADEYFSAIEKIVDRFKNAGYPNLKVRMIVEKTVADESPEHTYSLDRLVERRAQATYVNAVSQVVKQQLQTVLAISPHEVTQQADHLHAYFADIYRNPVRDWTNLFLPLPELTLYTAMQAALAVPGRPILLGKLDGTTIQTAYALYEDGGIYLSNPTLFAADAVKQTARGKKISEMLSEGKGPFNLLKIEWDPMAEALMGDFTNLGVSVPALMQALKSSSHEAKLALNKKLEPLYFQEKTASQAAAIDIIKAFMNP